MTYAHTRSSSYQGFNRDTTKTATRLAEGIVILTGPTAHSTNVIRTIDATPKAIPTMVPAFE